MIRTGRIARSGTDASVLFLHQRLVGQLLTRRVTPQVGPDVLVNRRSTTWRQLPEHERPAMEPVAVLPALQGHPTLVKRPVFERGGEVRVGFSDEVRNWLENP